MNKKVKKIISIIIIFAILSLMFNSNISSASDMKSDAKKITFGVVESGNIYASILNDKDVNYTFSLTKRTTLKFDVNWYSKLSDVVNLYVYNDAGKQVHKERALDGKIYNQYIYTLDAGIYYIVLRYIKNDYGNIGYNLKISEYNTNYLYNYSAIDCENSNEIKFNDLGDSIS